MSEFDHEYDDYNIIAVKDVWGKDIPQKFQLIPWQEFAHAELPSWIIKDILFESELAVIYGEPGSGKTFMALDAAMSIARGCEWQGKRVKKGRVIYIAAEGAGGFRKRLLAYKIYHKITTEEIDFQVISDSPNFLHNQDSQDIIKNIGKCDVIIVDTFSRTMPGGNENAADDVGFAINQCKEIHKETGALVILIHHSGKDAERGARGWSGLKGAADTEIEIIRLGDARKGRISKQKDGDDSFEWGFKLDILDIGTDEDGDTITSCVYISTNSIPLAEQKPRALGKYEQIVINTFVALNIYSIDMEEIIEICKKSMAYDINKEDRRRDNIIRAINALKSKNLIDIVDGHICKS